MQEKAKRGFLEDWRIGAELATTAVFDALRWLIRKALFMPEREAFSPLGVNGTGPGWALGSQVLSGPALTAWHVLHCPGQSGASL